jgi:hypothetical protein
VHTTQFDLTPEQATTLVANGRAATEAFLAAQRSAPVVAPPGALPSAPAPITATS